ncbi:MAG: NAD(P)-dependent oxidoreductase [Sterolibacterium sp.]
MSVKAQRIGFIGAGNMGRPMIRRLVEAGYRVTVSVRREEARTAVARLGASTVDTPAEAAAQADLLLTNVTTTSDVEAVLFGTLGATATMNPGCTVIDFSTISPLAVGGIAERVRVRGGEFLDAPVSGGIKGAETGTLSIMVGGDQRVLERARPVLACLGQTITHIGPNGAGQVAKACNQLVQVINIQGIAEAVQFATRMRVDPSRVLTAIAAGMAGSKMLDLMGPKMEERDFSAGIEARLHAKDFGLVCHTIDEMGICMPATNVVRAQLERLVAEGWGSDDTSSLLRVLEVQSIESKACASREAPS